MNLLEQCARSGQLSAAQINQHEQAGEMSLSRLALHRVPDAVGYESAQPSLVKAPRAAVAPLLDGPYRPKRKPESALSILTRCAWWACLAVGIGGIAFLVLDAARFH